MQLHDTPLNLPLPPLSSWRVRHPAFNYLEADWRAVVHDDRRQLTPLLLKCVI